MKTRKKNSAAAPKHLSFAVRHAFLGHRILGELRILMRLAMSETRAVSRSAALLERDAVSY